MNQRVWIGEKNFRLARQKTAGILYVFQGFFTPPGGNFSAKTGAGIYPVLPYNKGIISSCQDVVLSIYKLSLPLLFGKGSDGSLFFW